MVVDNPNVPELEEILRVHKPDLFVSGNKEKYLAYKIGVPFVKADATKFSETGYVGNDELELLMRQDRDPMDLALDRAPQLQRLAARRRIAQPEPPVPVINVHRLDRCPRIPTRPVQTLLVQVTIRAELRQRHVRKVDLLPAKHRRILRLLPRRHPRRTRGRNQARF